MALIRDPATGQLIDDSNISMGQGLVNTANNLGTIVRGTGQGLLNAAGGAVIAPFDAVRQGLTAAAGGSVQSLGAPLADQAWKLADQGFSDAGNAASRVGQGLVKNAQAGLLNLLGAQPAAPAQAAAPAPVSAPAVPAPTVAPAAPAAPAQGLLTATDLDPINQAIANGLATGQAQQPAPQVGGVVGNSFNASNTPVGTPGAAGNNGINFFSGSESPQAYLQRMDIQDRQQALDRNNDRNYWEQQSLLSHLNDPMTSPQQQKILLKQLQIMSPQVQGQTQQATQFAVAGANAATGASNAQLQRAAALQQAQLNNAGKLAVANIGANATLGASLNRAAGMTQAAGLRAASNGGSQRLANAQADNLQSIQALTIQRMAETDPARQLALDHTIASLKAAQVPLQPQAKDPVTGLYIAPEAQQSGQALQILQYQNQLNKALQQ